MNSKRRWIDITVSIREGMVRYPSDPVVRIRNHRSIQKGSSCNVTELSLGSHTGTHMDAPRHFFQKAKSLDHMPFDAVVGPARILHIRNRCSITKTELRKHNIRQGERILFKSSNSLKCWKTNRFVKNFVYITKEAAQFLAKKKLRTVGIDYLSVGSSSQGGQEVHRLLLGAGIWIIEGLNFSRVSAGEYDLICLPLKIAKADGAPARVIVRRR